MNPIDLREFLIWVVENYPTNFTSYYSEPPDFKTCDIVIEEDPLFNIYRLKVTDKGTKLEVWSMINEVLKIDRLVTYNDITYRVKFLGILDASWFFIGLAVL